VAYAVRTKTAHGNIPFVRGPKELGIQLIANLEFTRSLKEEEQQLIINAAVENVTEYINNLDVGEDFIAQEALERIFAASNLIKKVGSLRDPFEKLFIWKPSLLEEKKV